MKKPNNKRKQKSKALAITALVLRIFLIVILASAAIGGGIVFGALASYIENTELVDVQNLSVNLTSFIYAEGSDGNIYQLETLYDDENRVWASLDEIPLNLQRAFIAIEDERFFQHKGFDVKRTLGASFGYIKNKITHSNDTTYGGSTLTQQLIKNITGEDDYSPGRKIQEIYRAYKLEQELTKNQILEMYLNTIYLSQQCNGVKSAAKVYFNKELYELTLPECATIAAITQFPSKYDPKKNPENNKARRNVILAKMCELGYITEEERAEAAATDVVTVSKEEGSISSSATSYYTDALIEQVINDLVEQKGYTEAIAQKMLYCGGFKIYSAVDMDIQAIMDSYYADDSNFPTLSSDEIAQSSMVIIDPYTGYVKGIVGGRGVKEGSRTLNRATQTLRQPGSSIKPLSIYAPSVEYGKVTPTTLVSDSPITIGDWSPRNDDRKFKGNISVSSALAGSRNVPAVRILQHLGLDRSYNFVKRNFRISSLVDSREQNGKVFSDKSFAAIGLGGLTDGVSVLEMAAAYVPFVSGGNYYSPSFYTRVENSYGEVILQRDPSPQPAISESTAVTMTEMLQNVTKSGTGTSARLSSMPSAGKTGTTSNNYDRWFVGYTPYYVGAVWFGYDIPRSLKSVSGNPSAKVWNGIMERVHANLEYKSFPSLGSASKVLVCAESGLLPNSTCEDLTFGEYSKNAAPKKRCSLHRETDEGEGNLVVYTAPAVTTKPHENTESEAGDNPVEVSPDIDISAPESPNVQAPAPEVSE
jgi:penicillin-binding protein 1A